MAVHRIQLNNEVLGHVHTARPAASYPSEIDLYAGDTIITSSADCNSMVRLQESLSTSVSDVFNWALANRLPLNKEKTTGPISEGKATLDQKK